MIPEDQVDAVGEKVMEWFDKLQKGEEPDIPEELQPYLPEILNSSTTQGMRMAFDSISIMLVVAFLATLMIPSTKKD